MAAPGLARASIRVLSALLAAVALGFQPVGAESGGAVGLPETSGETPEAHVFGLLDRMNAALGSLAFEGTLVYLFDNRLETLQLVHRVDGGQVQERLVSLSGPVRSVTRSQDRVICVMPHGRPISVKRPSAGRLLPAQRIGLADLAGRYRLEPLGTARVAGRETDVVAIRPLDALRYGYRLYLDRGTGLPLKSDLIDTAGAAIEQLLFASLTLGAGDPLPAVPSGGGSGDGEGLAPAPAAATPWRFDRRPAGFEQTLHDAMRDASGARVERFLFSDRLSSYSIYIESDTRDGLAGVTRAGAAHAVGRRVGDYQLTAVGEVPAATLEAAVAGASRVPEATP